MSRIATLKMNPLPDDTIAAIATAPGEGAVSIVRISGLAAVSIADQIFVPDGKPSPLSDLPSHQVVYGNVQIGDRRIDEVLLFIMRAPRSYTREDVVEIQGHGGTLASRSILRACLSAGARLAEPGEFTRRAFLNGRIDLIQAEAVADLIRSQSDRASAAALEQLDGKLSEVFDDLYNDLLLVTAQIEATLDFPEDELPAFILSQLATSLDSINGEFQAVLATWEEGHLLRDGALVVISGKPNVGKSTLLNALLKTERAIVSNIAGTTRDSIEETLVLGGFPVRLVDTAGLRTTEDAVEAIGVERTRALIEKADAHLVVVDACEPPDPSLLDGLDSKRTLLVVNKIDLCPAPKWNTTFPTCTTSLIKKEGVEDLKTALLELLSNRAELAARPHAVISERHRQLVEQANGELRIAKEHVASQREEQLFLAASHCRQALEHLGEATGKVFQEELLDRIFSEFCIGK